MAHSVEFESQVAGGFPVWVKGTIYPAEPDVGLDFSYADDFEIMTTRGKPAPWIEDKITPDDWGRLADEALEAFRLGE